MSRLSPTQVHSDIEPVVPLLGRTRHFTRKDKKEKPCSPCLGEVHSRTLQESTRLKSNQTSDFRRKTTRPVHVYILVTTINRSYNFSIAQQILDTHSRAGRSRWFRFVLSSSPIPSVMVEHQQCGCSLLVQFMFAPSYARASLLIRQLSSRPFSNMPQM